MNILITGHSRGLGEALATLYLAAGHRVYGLSRTRWPSARALLTEVCCDLADGAAIAPALARFGVVTAGFDLAFLNAGLLGRIANLRDTPMAAIATVMDVNVWANKILLDWLAAQQPAPRQIILMSSGAAVVGHHGWGAYALSKATLNMLAQLYAHEMPHSHLLALAPGLIDTDMQAELGLVDTAEFDSLRRLHQARGSAEMPSAATTAMRIATQVAGLTTRASGSFVDLRRL